LQENDADLLHFEDEDREDEDDIEPADYDGMDDNDDDSMDYASTKGGPQQLKIPLTSALLKETLTRAKEGKLKDIKALQYMFEASSTTTADFDEEEENASTHPIKYLITNPELHEEVMLQTIKCMFHCWNKYLRRNKNWSIQEIKNLNSNNKWTKLQFTILSFFKSIISILNTVGHLDRHHQLTVYLLQSLEVYIPFLGPLTRMMKTMIKCLSGLLFARINDATPDTILDEEEEEEQDDYDDDDEESSEEEDDTNHNNNNNQKKNNKNKKQKVSNKKGKQQSQKKQSKSSSTSLFPMKTDYQTIRSQVLLRLLQMGRLLPGNSNEEICRTCYLLFARTCKSHREANATTILYVSHCLVELLKQDVAIAYQLGFAYIRQLGLHLRAAYLPSSNSHKKGGGGGKQASNHHNKQLNIIRSWQYYNCLRLWVLVIQAMPSEEVGVGALCYPLWQIMQGTMDLFPSPYYVPYRFHLISLCQRLANRNNSKSNTALPSLPHRRNKKQQQEESSISEHSPFIPSIHPLLDILEYAEFHTKPIPSTERVEALQYTLQLPPNSWQRVPVRDMILREVIHYIRQEAELWKNEDCFPEYFHLVIIKCKRFVKQCKISKHRELIKVLIQQILEMMHRIKQRRIYGQDALDEEDRKEKAAKKATAIVTTNALKSALKPALKHVKKVVEQEEEVDDDEIASDEDYEEESNIEEEEVEVDRHQNKKSRKEKKGKVTIADDDESHAQSFSNQLKSKKKKMQQSKEKTISLISTKNFNEVPEEAEIDVVEAFSMDDF
jgi:hypothetical protein